MGIGAVALSFVWTFGGGTKTRSRNVARSEYGCNVRGFGNGNCGFFQRVISKVSTVWKISWAHAVQQLLHDRDLSDAGALSAMVLG